MTYTLTEEERDAVLDALRKVTTRGYAFTTARWSVGTGLTRWQRFFNWLAKRLGADREPFKDPYNFKEIEAVRLADAEPFPLESAMRKLAPSSVCRICGSTNLAADPSGYYEHAKAWHGGSLLCLNHDESLEPYRQAKEAIWSR